MDEESKNQRKKIVYVAVCLTLFLSFWFVRGFTWQGNTQLHTLMELAATMLATFIGVMALVRFYSKKNNTFLLIGVGFLGTASLDGYHALVTSSFFDQVLPSAPSSLIPWSWNASRLFLSVLMFLSWWVWRRETLQGEDGKLHEKSIFLIVGAMTLSTFLFFAFFPLPPAYYPENIFGRPEEFVSAVFFLVALIGYYQKGKWKDSSFEHWIVLSLLIGFMSQVMFMPFSLRLFDGMFDVAHLLKNISYLCVLTGLFSNMYQLFNQLEQQKEQLEEEITEHKQTAVTLQATNRNLDTVLINLPVGVAILESPDFRYSKINHTLADINGLSIEEHLGKPIAEVLPHAAADIIPELQRVLDTGEATPKREFTTRLPKDPNQLRYFIDAFFPIFGVDGNPEAVGVMVLDITERKATENELIKERILLRAITDTAIDFIYVKDTQGRHIFSNPAYLQFLGKKHLDEVLGKTNIEIHGKELGTQYDADEQVIMDNMQSKISQTESRLGSDGKPMWFSTTKVPWQNDTGVVNGIVGISHDITDKRTSEMLLQENEERYRSLMEDASMAIVIIDQEGQISSSNAKIAELFGYDREELLGQSLEILMPERYRGVHISHRKNYFDDPNPRSMGIGYDLFGQRKDGSEFPVEIGLSFAQVGDELIGMAYVIDITARKQAEKVLVESEEQYKALFNNAPVAIFTKDVEGRYTSANADTLTYWATNPIGCTDKELLPADIAEALRAVDVQVMATGQELTLEEQLLTDDKFRTLLSRKVPIRNADGNVTGILGISLDITENKQVAMLLEDRALELERSNEELTQFAYVISHDLGEPLRAITSYLELFSRRYKGQIDDRADKYINYAVDGAVRMQALIIDLLAYSRTGKQNHALGKVDFEKIFEASVANLHVTIRENDAVITHDELPTGLGDVSQATQLFQNLIGNGIKYQGDTPPHIHVSATKRKRVWVFSVKDNGIGIAPEYHKRIFQVFQRLHTREEYLGTGIGLAICKKIVQNHGGTIWIESEVGKGSTFYFTLSREKDFNEQQSR